MSDWRRFTWLSLALVFAMGGCASVNELVSSLNASDQDATSAYAEGHANLVEYYNWLDSASPEAIQKEYVILLTNLEQRGTPEDKLAMSLLLSRSDTPYGSTEQARALAQEYLGTTAERSEGNLGLAKLLNNILEQNASLERTQAEAQQGLAKAQARVSVLDTEVSRLENQIEQLKALEQDILAKEKAVSVPTLAPTSDGQEEDSLGR
jgi:hypothetical protein